MNDFVLNWNLDASLRKASPDKLYHVPPYLLNDSFDAHLVDEYSICPAKFGTFTVGNVSFYTSAELLKFVKYSDRPLRNTYSDYYSAFNVALKKLNAEVGLIDLTSFIIRTGTLISPQSVLSHQLVLSGAATFSCTLTKAETIVSLNIFLSRSSQMLPEFA